MLFYVYAWLAAFSSGTAVLLQKLTSKYSIKNPWLFNFLISFFILLFTIPISFYYHVGLPHQWTNVILASLFNTLFYVLYTLALYKLDVTVLSPLLNTRGVFGVLLGVIFLGESLRINQIAFIVLIIVASFLISIDEKFRITSILQRGVFLIVFASLALALNGFFINKATNQIGYWELTLWQSIFTFIFLLLTLPFFINNFKKLGGKKILATSFIALLFVLYNLTANKAYSMNVAITSVIISLPISMMLAFVLSLFAPRLLEKHTLKVYIVRFVGAAVAIFSAFRL